MSEHIQTLLSVLRGDNDRIDWSSIETDWRRFAALCEVHQLAPFVFWQLKNVGGTVVPPELFAFLRRRFFEVSARNYRLAKEAVEITSFLREHRLNVLVYKGPAVAMTAYGDLALRQFQDLDLVIRDTDVFAALDLLVRRGFEIAQYWRLDDPRELSKSREVTLAAPDKAYFVDLHWRLASERVQVLCPDMEQMWDRVETIRLPTGSILTFCPEDLFLALCCHGAWHRWGRLKWLVDIAEMLRRQDLNWDRIETMTVERPLARESVTLGVVLASDLLYVQTPGLPKAFEGNTRARSVGYTICHEILSRGHTVGLDREHATLPELEGTIRAWIDYFWSKYPGWFFEHAICRIHTKDRCLISVPKHLEFLYHIIRPIRLVSKHSARLARLALSNRN